MNIVKNGWALVYDSGIPVRVGDVCSTGRGETVTVTGGRPPHTPASTGRVWVRHSGTKTESEYFPSVCQMKWMEPNDGAQ